MLVSPSIAVISFNRYLDGTAIYKSVHTTYIYRTIMINKDNGLNQWHSPTFHMYNVHSKSSMNEHMQSCQYEFRHGNILYCICVDHRVFSESLICLQ